MGESNEDWGRETDPNRVELWDQLGTLPGAGEDKLLDKLLKEKRMTREDMARIGTRIGTHAGKACLVWLFPDGFKYRALIDGQRYSEEGVQWKQFKRVRSRTGPPDASHAIVAEGETDGATLAKLFPDYDILITPAGAKAVTPEMVQQAGEYTTVLAGYDNDDAGNAGAKSLLGQVPHAVRILPPAEKNDWNAAWAVGAIGPATDISSFIQKVPRTVFTARELLDADLGEYNENHWFDLPILPQRGLMAIHAQKKSLKSFVALEMQRALATGTAFGGYIPYAREAAARVLMIQLEIPPFDLRSRVRSITCNMAQAEAAMFDQNALFYQMANNRFPRVKVTRKGFDSELLRVCQEAEADVVIFDPIQRMLGSANVNAANELDLLLSMFEDLAQNHGFTVVFLAHNNKLERDAKGGHGMSGSQRLSGDPDAICSLWHGKGQVEDGNEQMVKARNLTWELRSGSAPGRSITVKPHGGNSELVEVSFGDPHQEHEEDHNAPAI